MSRRNVDHTFPPMQSRSPVPAPLVDRTMEMSTITGALTTAAGGRGSAIFLSGEAGIGKTRLAREGCAMAQARGFRVLEGHAFRLEGSLAYGPLVDALGPFLRGLDHPRLMLLLDGLSDLGRLFADLPLVVPGPLGDAGLEKLRLFEAMARLIERLSQTTPVLLFLDDLQWADSDSIELLHYLARTFAHQRALLLATYQAEEIDGARALATLLASLRRAGLATELALSRLSVEGVAALVRGWLRSPISDELLTVMERRAAGSPLFVDELLRALRAAGQLVRVDGVWTVQGEMAIVPATVRVLILERLGRLGPAEREVVDLLAVGGGTVAYALASMVSSIDDERLLGILRRLQRTGLVAEVLDDAGVAYRLTHPLIQEVAYAELPEIVRRRAHAAFTCALEGRMPDDVAQLARHYRGAGTEADPERGLEALFRAGEQARQAHAYDQAARHFEAGLRLVRAGRRGELLPLLLERLGTAWERLGEGGVAVAFWIEAIGEYMRTGNVPAVAGLHRLIAAIEWERGHLDAAQAHLAAGLALLREHTPSPELADLLHLRVSILRRGGDLARLPAAVGDLAAAAAQLALPRALVEARLAEVELHDVRGERRAAYDQGQLALTIAQAAGEPLLIYRAHEMLAVIAFSLGDHRAARQHAGGALEIAGQVNAPTLESRAYLYLSMASLHDGSWDQALQQSTRAALLARRVGRARTITPALIGRSMVLARRGDLEAAEAVLAEARAVYGPEGSGDRHTRSGIDLAEAFLRLEQGNVARARVVAGDFMPIGGSSGTQPLGPALIAEAQARAGDVEAALATARALARLDGETPSYATALAAYAEGLAYQGRGEDDAALAALENASRLFAGLEMPFEASRARLVWAELIAARSPEDAAEAACESLEVLERLGARRCCERARRLLRGLGIRRPADRRTHPTGGPLSPREIDVARLVAEKLTNAEIAARLVVSTRTITTHLERIYSRLHITSRAELARYVVETGLAPLRDDVA